MKRLARSTRDLLNVIAAPPPPKERVSISLTYHSSFIKKAIAHRSSRGIRTTEAKYRASLIYPKDDQDKRAASARST